jgi:hypothetical protein
MRVRIESDRTRPHLISPQCWCRPVEVEPRLWVHHDVEGRPDVQVRACAFSL